MSMIAPVVSPAQSPVSALREPVVNCPDCGGACLASRGCALCAFDRKYAETPLDACSDCGAGVTGEQYTCGSCRRSGDARTECGEVLTEDGGCGYCLHAALLFEAQAAVATLTRAEGNAESDAVLAFAREALAGSADDSTVGDLAGHLAVL